MYKSRGFVVRPDLSDTTRPKTIESVRELPQRCIGSAADNEGNRRYHEEQEETGLVGKIAIKKVENRYLYASAKRSLK